MIPTDRQGWQGFKSFYVYPGQLFLRPVFKMSQVVTRSTRNRTQATAKPRCSASGLPTRPRFPAFWPFPLPRLHAKCYPWPICRNCVRRKALRNYRNANIAKKPYYQNNWDERTDKCFLNTDYSIFLLLFENIHSMKSGISKAFHQHTCPQPGNSW